MEVSAQFHTPAALFPGKDASIAKPRHLGVPQSRSLHFGEKNIFYFWRESSPNFLFVHPLTCSLYPLEYDSGY